MKILIADAGATKTDWVKLSSGNESSEWSEERYSGVGISPLHHDTDMIEEELRLVRASLGETFDMIHFFGAGIGTPLIAGKMEAILSEMFSSSEIRADSDMAAAASALLGDNPGVACIMGTGSNSCHYDGQVIDRKSASLGYLLDDEGGGVAYSRRLLSDVFKGLAPRDVIDKFEATYSLSISDVVVNLYRRPSPNRWIAGFMPFIVENADNPYIKKLIESQTERFFDREFASYPDKLLKEEGIGFVGSVADVLRPFVEAEMNKRGWRTRAIERQPLDSLVKQYKLKNS
ncbi:MAG: hypothetical protein K2H38_00975 [Muribaculaceae bacterium]|nr:hypothetical protein [Muribaculaceae bacterium]MDE6552748.1 hypothetical protein [Muribaculaceae bacterium]